MKVNKNKIIKRAGILILVIIIITGGYYAFYSYKSKKTNTTTMQINYTVKKGSIQSTVSAVGTITASDSRDITVPAGSTVISVNCTEGQAVKSGDVLFTLSNDSAKLDLKKSQDNLSQLKSQLNNLESNLKQLDVYAPASGIVKTVNVGVQDSVNPQSGNQNPLIQIEDASSMGFSIPANVINNEISLSTGQEIDVLIAGVGDKTAKVSQQGSSFLLQISNTSGLSLDKYYNITLKLQNKDIEISTPVQLTGTLINVNAKQSGTVAAVYVKPGDYVKNSQKLLSLNNDSLNSQIQTIEDNIQSAQLDVNNKQGIVDSLTVKAPIDGIIYNIQAKAGDVIGYSSTSKTSNSSNLNSNNNSSISQSQNVVASIVNNSSMQILASVDELDIGKIKTGQDVTIKVDAFNNKSFKGKVVSVNPQGTVQNGAATFQVKINIDNPDGLMSGMTANVSILVASKEDALLLPVDAIQDRSGRKVVFINENGRIVPKEVTLGIVNTDYAEIVSGLNEGDSVVVQIQRSNSTNSNRSSGFMGISGMGGQGFMNNRDRGTSSQFRGGSMNTSRSGN